jgi:transposase
MAAPVLKRCRYLWLKDQQDWNRRPLRQYVDLRRLNLKSHRAYRIKESLREIFRLAHPREEAEALLTRWYGWARRCRLEPMEDFAKTVKTHWDGILNAFDSKLTNGRVEAAKAQIQAAKAKARGYGTVRHLITIADLVAGKLTHLPSCPFATKQCAKASA